MKTRILFFVLIVATTFCHAQQDAQYTQYMYNTININPAYAGSRDVLSMFGLYRTQWVGLRGAPDTKTFSINAPITNSNLGVGLGVIADRIGPSDETNVAADISYGFPISKNFKLSFGIKGSVNLLNVDFTKLDIFNAADPRFQTNIDNRFSPNIGAGFYLYSDKTYLGVSVPNFLETQHFDRNANTNSNSFIAKERLHYYVIAGHVFDLTDEIQFKPAALFKIVGGAPLQLDLSGNFMFREKFLLGAAYRVNAAVSAMAGFQTSIGIFIGYGYDLETTSLRQFNSGSHEIFMRFELFRNYDKIIAPRFF